MILAGDFAITETSEQRAILFADVCDSTSIYESVGDAKALALINSLFKALDKAVNVNGGVTVKTLGDGARPTRRSAPPAACRKPRRRSMPTASRD